MAVRIVSGGNYVSKVVIGTPIKRVKGALNLSNIADIDLTGLSDGDLLQYDSDLGKWGVSTTLGDQELDGGNF
jgi:phage baseplate assembly protein gpV